MKIMLTAIVGSCLGAYGLSAYAVTENFTASDCIDAKEHCILQVKPPLPNSNHPLFHVKQLCDGSYEFFKYPLEDQISNRKFFGRKFCHGVVSYSNMDLPFISGPGIANPHDGMLAIEMLDEQSKNIIKLIEKMNYIATQASTGQYSSTQLANLDNQFQMLSVEVNRIANVTSITGISVFNGATDSLSVPLKDFPHTIQIPLANFTTESVGLNISSLDVLTVDDAQNALLVLQEAEQKIKSAEEGFDSKKPILKAAEKHEAVMTSFDLNGPLFIVKKEKVR